MRVVKIVERVPIINADGKWQLFCQVLIGIHMFTELSSVIREKKHRPSRKVRFSMLRKQYLVEELISSSMTRYYHNENPQVILWRELAQKSQEAAMESQEIAWKAVEEADEWKSMVKEAIDNTSEANELSNKLNDTLDGYRMLIQEFNSLPWYKKMFFKFKL